MSVAFQEASWGGQGSWKTPDYMERQKELGLFREDGEKLRQSA